MSGEQGGEAAGETEGVQVAYSSEGPHGLGQQLIKDLPAGQEQPACTGWRMRANGCRVMALGTQRTTETLETSRWVSLGSVERGPDRHLSYKIGAPSFGKQTTIGKGVFQKRERPLGQKMKDVDWKTRGLPLPHLDPGKGCPHPQAGGDAGTALGRAPSLCTCARRPRWGTFPFLAPETKT